MLDLVVEGRGMRRREPPLESCMSRLFLQQCGLISKMVCLLGVSATGMKKVRVRSIDSAYLYGVALL